MRLWFALPRLRCATLKGVVWFRTSRQSSLTYSSRASGSHRGAGKDACKACQVNTAWRTRISTGDCPSVLGLSVIVLSSAAIAAGEYKTVNTAAASVIGAVANALPGDFPFAFGADGASFAVPPEFAEVSRQTLAAVPAWVRDDLNMNMRVAIFPIVETGGGDL